MVEIVISVAAKISEYLVAPMILPFTYLCNYKSNFENLKNEIGKLRVARESVLHRVDDAKRNGEDIEQKVEKWLSDVDKIMDAAGQIIEDEERAKNSRCFRGLCPNLTTCYQLSKKAAKEMVVIAGVVQEQGNFDKAFESRMSTLNDVLNALNNPNVNMIGVYGMAGVGKTKLVKEAARLAKKDKLFDEVVFAEVSQISDIKKIQGQISDKMGLKFYEESESRRARRLCERLKKEKKILVILDNIWASLDFEKVGIPFGDNHKGFLNEREAWNLFKKISGDYAENEDLQSIAKDVAKACGCLPIAIVTIARALRNKSVFEWKNALQELRRPSGRSFTGVPAEAYSTIELCYNHLEGEELKSTFLLCSLMVHIQSATIQYLLSYGMGLGLFGGIDRIEEAWNRVYMLVNKLKTSCLLLDGHTSEEFSMHDVVRDDLSVQQIPNNFFIGMTELRVLDFVAMHLPSLPSSLCLLSNLQTLCLDYGVFGDVSIIGELKTLEILSFQGSNIEEFPREIGQLTRLRLLNLAYCNLLKVIPSNVLSSLSRLEELYMGYTFVEWEIEGLNNVRSKASLHELKQLSYLTNLEIQIQDANVLSKGLLSKKLKRYKIFIGDEWNWSDQLQNSRILKLKLNNSTWLKDDVFMQMKGIEELYLDEMRGVKNIVYDLDREGFPKLKHPQIQNNPYFLYVIDSVKHVPRDAFRALESLSLSNLINLEKICHGKLKAESFCKLTTLKVKSCDKLSFIFSFSVARSLPQLQTIEVIACKNMKEIFAVLEFAQLRKLTLKSLPHLRSFCSLLKKSYTPERQQAPLTIGSSSNETAWYETLISNLAKL
ncbi:hypothetical protein CICLE_v10014275mg [Citrus x clementina]|uniref:NB-ARC domain-containing protein n=1 Tax=Citrus clementina TaxID=85681 RepID=V4W0J7_CITCL|nr:hypothetical protein CICLE_v10014275mg [Citrus x clementina]